MISITHCFSEAHCLLWSPYPRNSYPLFECPSSVCSAAWRFPDAGDPVHTSKWVPAWYGKRGARRVKPNPSKKKELWEQVLCKQKKEA